MLESYIEGAYKTFPAHVPADLVDKENYLVQLRSDGDIELLTSGIPLGTLFNKLEGGTDWTVRLLGKGGTVKVVAGGVIATPARVKPASGGKVVTIGTSGRSVGIKLSPVADSADNSVIEIYDVVEPITATIVAQSAPVVAATGNTDTEISALTFSSTPTQAEANALRDKCEELGDDVRALRNTVATLVTTLTTAGVLA